MSETWKNSALGELLTTHFDGAWGEPSTNNGGDVPILRSTEMRGGTLVFETAEMRSLPPKTIEKKKLVPGDILVNKSSGSAHLVGLSVLFPTPPDNRSYLCSNFVHCLRPNQSEVEPEFLSFTLLSPQFREQVFRAQNTTSGLRNLNLTEYLAAKIIYPSRPEQRHVVSRIKECLSRVEEMQCLRAEILAETPLVEDRFLAELENTLGGCTVPLGELLAETQNGKSLQNKETGHNGRALTLSAVKTYRLDMSASKPVQINADRDDKYLMQPGDVLISRSNTRELVALSAIAPDHIEEPTIFSDLLIRMTPKTRDIRPLYLTIALRMPGVRHQLRANAVGSSQTMVKISGERLRTVKVPCPPLAEQERIERKYIAVTSMTSAISEELDGQTRDLNALRESILREAFAGNL